MSEFLKAYDSLNAEQKEAVDTTDGPLLVIAGPGTGKTQLLSARVAHILNTTDTLPQNIICLTFTESGAANMRERLASFIGQAAYDVTIGTYHAFGGEIIKRYAEYFPSEQIGQPVDNLTQYKIINQIAAQLDYHDPLKYTMRDPNQLLGLIGDMKSAALSPDDLRDMAAENALFIDNVDNDLLTIFAGFKTMPRKIDQALSIFQPVLESIVSHNTDNPVNQKFGSLATSLEIELRKAIEEGVSTDSTKPLTAWKNKWLGKNKSNRFYLDQRRYNQRLISLASIYEAYEAELKKLELYDFNDMILNAIKALQENDDLRFTLQEQYLYILLDEFQDTNNAQAELVYLLTDNPVNEGRPNIMAVGDDDQAIFAFQGAQFSNMIDFYNRFRDTKVINLKQNYRSHADILTTAHNIATQIDQRLTNSFKDGMLDKELIAAGRHEQSHIERRDFKSSLSEYNWVASEISKLIHEKGVKPDQIAVLAPKHFMLTEIMPYLNHHDISVRYEKRDNVLEEPPIVELLNMCRLVLAIGNDEKAANQLWPAVLSFEGYKLPVSSIWQISWQVSDGQVNSWTRALLESDNLELRKIAWFYSAVAQKTQTESCEMILDYLTGTTPIALNEPEVEEYTNIYRQHYLDSEPGKMHATLSSLTVLRTNLRDYQKTNENLLKVQDLINLVDDYEAANEKMLNTNPYNEADSAVQLMTAFKAKGLEFEYVFMLSVNDDQWGMKGASGGRTVKLPHNLAPTHHAGDNEDEKLRLLFVAVTRAKHTLYMTNFLSTYSGKNTTRLKYTDEREAGDKNIYSHILPEQFQIVGSHDDTAPELTTLENQWQNRHLLHSDATLNDLLKQRLDSYQMSPTHVNSYYDTSYGGPSEFFIKTILRFPSAPGTDGQFGNAVHETMEWLQHQANKQVPSPSDDEIREFFASALKKQKMTEIDYQTMLTRGQRAIITYLRARPNFFKSGNKAEANFRNEGVFIGDAHLSGKIDSIEIDKINKTVRLVDFKTGNPYDKWVKSSTKLHKYRQQLIAYKLLVEGSHTFQGYTVLDGRLEFVEPDNETGEILPPLVIDYSDKEEIEYTKRLVEATWKAIKSLDFPDISEYKADINGVLAFEQFMLDKYQ